MSGLCYVILTQAQALVAVASVYIDTLPWPMGDSSVAFHRKACGKRRGGEGCEGVHMRMPAPPRHKEHSSAAAAVLACQLQQRMYGELSAALLLLPCPACSAARYMHVLQPVQSTQLASIPAATQVFIGRAVGARILSKQCACVCLNCNAASRVGGFTGQQSSS